MANDTSTYHLTTCKSFTFKVSTSSYVPLRNFSTHTNFFQSLFVGALTLGYFVALFQQDEPSTKKPTVFLATITDTNKAADASGFGHRCGC